MPSHPLPRSCRTDSSHSALLRCKGALLGIALWSLWMAAASVGVGMGADANVAQAAPLLDSNAAGSDEIRHKTQRLSFIGFSKNEMVSAWKVEVRITTSAEPSTFDSYSLVSLIKNKDQKIIGQARLTPVRRTKTSQRGKKSTRTLSSHKAAQEYPEWADAEPVGEWSKIRNRWNFSATPLEMNSSVFRLRLDPKSDARVAAHDRSIHIEGAQGQPLIVEPVAWHAGGKMQGMGQLAVAAPADPTGHIEGEIRAYFPPSGEFLAILGQFTRIEDEGRAQTPAHAAAVIPFARPVGTVELGTFRLTSYHVRSGSEDFKKMHPKSAHFWDTYVGTYWNALK